MNNILQKNYCKIINIVWIERGILLILIYYLVKKYDILLKKTIIIDNQRYCDFLKLLFPKLNFSKFTKHYKKNFYFNIRTIIKKQDIIIDYVNNYFDYINTNKIVLIPWYDMNDILIAYEYNKKEKIKFLKRKLFIVEFSKCRRGGYGADIWDIYVENYIFTKYILFAKKVKLESLLIMFNNFIKKNYTNTVIEHPRVYYVPVQQNFIQNIILPNNHNFMPPVMPQMMPPVMPPVLPPVLPPVMPPVMPPVLPPVMPPVLPPILKETEMNNENRVNQLITLLNNKLNVINNLI